MKAFFWPSLVVWILAAAPAWGAAAERINLPVAVEVLQGELAEIRISSASLARVEGRWGKEKILFHREGDGEFSAIIGADVEAKPGTVKLSLALTDRSGALSQREIPVTIVTKTFRAESFKVAPGFDHMTPEALEEIRRERLAFARAFAASVPERLWEAPFVRPVPHQASASSFGARRIINGIPRAPHGGTDLSSPSGTEVLATNHGRVVLVGHFFFAGGAVVIDHGGGLFTMYFHLSELKVEEGMRVNKGDVVALSGATGRVTGAHLHWGARLANARVDPLKLLTKLSPREDGGETPRLIRSTEK